MALSFKGERGKEEEAELTTRRRYQLISRTSSTAKNKWKQITPPLITTPFYKFIE